MQYKNYQYISLYEEIIRRIKTVIPLFVSYFYLIPIILFKILESHNKKKLAIILIGLVGANTIAGLKYYL